MKLLMILAILSVTACGHRDYAQLSDQVAEYGLQSYSDKRTDVVCYMYRDGDYSALSCVKK